MYLYLAWERTNTLGSANMDFELNQVTTPNLGAAGAHTIVRTAGDLLITYDFGGSGSPVLGLRKWTGSAWGASTSLTGFSEGSVNTAAVTDPLSGGSLPSQTFGEAAINLTQAGVFGTNGATCGSFGSVYLKSRASSSFTSEVKDFVPPVAAVVTNCGSITINKVTSPTPDQTSTSTELHDDGHRSGRVQPNGPGQQAVHEPARR